MRILACVVAHDRAALLRQVLTALTEQTLEVDVLVLDNASTDATPDVAAEFAPRVRYFHTGGNLGGAGGFAWAVELSIALGYDFAYLLDDDAIPARDAIEVLVHARVRHPELAALPYLASCPVSADAARLPAGVPQPAEGFEAHARLLPAGAVAIDHASFLGVLLDLSAARRTALPFREFFIWCDDVEYTTRIGRGTGGACLPASRIQHESPEMEAGQARRALGWKFRYKVRNTLWLARWGQPDTTVSKRVGLGLAVVRATLNEFSASDHRVAAVRIGSGAWASGLLGRRPTPIPVGGLLAADARAAQWLERQPALV